MFFSLVLDFVCSFPRWFLPRSYYTLFKITCDSYNLIGYLCCDLFVLNLVSFLANEKALLKHNNQADLKACNQFNRRKMKDNFCNFLQTNSILGEENICTDWKIVYWILRFQNTCNKVNHAFDFRPNCTPGWVLVVMMILCSGI